MIIEKVEITVKDGHEAELEAAVEQAKAIFARAKGCLGIELATGIEVPGSYVLLIRWETLEAHTTDFRGSTLFQEWRALAGPHFAEPPEVLHFEVKVDAVTF